MVSSIIEKVSHFFADNRPLSLLLLVSIVLFGVVAFFVMPKQYNPEIVRPAFVLNFNYEGATKDEALNRVGYELIEKLQVVPGVDDIFTRVSDGANISSTVIFEVGYDKAQAKVDLLTQLQGYSNLSSGAVSQLQVQEINPETIPVLQIVFSSENLTLSEVREQVLSLRSSVLQVEGVSEMKVAGGENNSINIEVDPVKLQRAGISLVSLNAVLDSAKIRIRNTGFEDGRYAISSVFDARVENVESIGLLPLGNNIYLRDVATIYEGVSQDRSYVLYSDKNIEPAEVVMLAVSRQEGTSAPVVTKAVLNQIENLLDQNQYQDLAFKVVSDDGAVANKEIIGLTTNLVTSIAIVTLVLLLFLSTRAALVVLITIPLTFLLVIAIGFMFGESINRITLFALILSLGLLVDATIVVVDNIYTHLRDAHRQGRQTSLAVTVSMAVKEVGVGLVLSAVTSVIVFLPMRYISGMMGPYMGPISFFVPVALLVSLAIAIVLTPFIAMHILKGDEKENKVGLFFKDKLDLLTQKYVRLLKAIAYKDGVRKKVLGFAVLAFCVSLIFPLTGIVHFQMLPKADRDQFYLYVDVPQGTAREATRAFTEEVVAVALEHSEVMSTQLFVAGAPIVDFNGLFKGAPERTDFDQATVRVNLTTASARALSSTDIATEVRTALKKEFGDKATYVRIMEEPPGPPVAATLVAKIHADSKEVEEKAVTEIENLFGGVNGVVDIYKSIDTPVEEVVYKLNRDNAMVAGVSPREAGEWFSLLSKPKLVSEYIASDSQERVLMYVQLPKEYTENPSGINRLLVGNSSDNNLPLGSLVSTSYELKSSATYLEAALPVQYVTAEVEGRSIVYVVIELMKRIIAGELPSYEVASWSLFDMTLQSTSGDKFTLAWGGEWEMTLENFRDLGVAMIIALFLVYGVLVAQYRSFAWPGFILVTVPLGLVGIFFGFLILDVGFGIYLTATALIGFIALIGIVVNNAIIYLEYVEQAQAEGVNFTEALIAAGAVRLRPILLTSLTTVLGSLTIASDPVWSGLAWAIIFGLSLSTILTLVIFPALLLTFTPKNEAATPAE
jgi:multidrug efflux pump subunit AcrB